MQTIEKLMREEMDRTAEADVPEAVTHPSSNSLGAYISSLGAEKKNADKAILQYYRNWVESKLGLLDPRQPTGGYGFTDGELCSAIDDVLGFWDKDTGEWHSPPDTTVRTARRHWTVCTFKQIDCEDTHLMGETHDGQVPLIQNPGGSRPSPHSRPSTVWTLTEEGVKRCRTLWQDRPWSGAA